MQIHGSVTINLCLDCLRRRKFREDNRELNEQTPDPSPNPLDNCLNSEIQAILKRVNISLLKKG